MRYRQALCHIQTLSDRTMGAKQIQPLRHALLGATLAEGRVRERYRNNPMYQKVWRIILMDTGLSKAEDLYTYAPLDDGRIRRGRPPFNSWLLVGNGSPFCFSISPSLAATAVSINPARVRYGVQ